MSDAETLALTGCTARKCVIWIDRDMARYEHRIHHGENGEAVLVVSDRQLWKTRGDGSHLFIEWAQRVHEYEDRR
jgi:hypothetical protein